MRRIIEILVVALLIFLLLYFIIYKYFLDWFCYIRSDDYLKCANTLVCSWERDLPWDDKLLCEKKDFFLFEKDSFLYSKETYINIYDNYIKSLKN